MGARTAVDEDTAEAVDAASADAMVRDMCAAVDGHDYERFAGYFSPTATYRFGNADPMHGHEAIVEATAGAVSALPPMHHRVDQVAALGRQLFCRFTIVVTADDGTLELPCVTVIELDPAGGRQIVDYRVHMDITPALRETP